MEKKDEICTLDPRKLPPPSPRAGHFHSQRVYLQIQRWMNLNPDYLNPCECGWVERGGTLWPITTDKVVAPENVLKYI